MVPLRPDGEHVVWRHPALRVWGVHPGKCGLCLWLGAGDFGFHPDRKRLGRRRRRVERGELPAEASNVIVDRAFNRLIRCSLPYAATPMSQLDAQGRPRQGALSLTRDNLVEWE